MCVKKMQTSNSLHQPRYQNFITLYSLMTQNFKSLDVCVT